MFFNVFYIKKCLKYERLVIIVLALSLSSLKNERLADIDF